MAAARKCDRCGKLFEPDCTCNGLKNIWHDIAIRKVNSSSVLFKEHELDLCNDCYDSLVGWISESIETETLKRHDAKLLYKVAEKFIEWDSKVKDTRKNEVCFFTIENILKGIEELKEEL